MYIYIYHAVCWKYIVGTKSWKRLHQLEKTYGTSFWEGFLHSGDVFPLSFWGLGFFNESLDVITNPLAKAKQQVLCAHPCGRCTVEFQDPTPWRNRSVIPEKIVCFPVQLRKSLKTSWQKWWSGENFPCKFRVIHWCTNLVLVWVQWSPSRGYIEYLAVLQRLDKLN